MRSNARSSASDRISRALFVGLAMIESLAIYCLAQCWMSWNAAKRAIEYGYRSVYWYRDGTDGWQELGYPLVDVPKVP